MNFGESPINRRFDFVNGLGTLDFHDSLAFFYYIADLLQPAANLAFDHTLAKLGHADGCCHHV